MKIRKQIYVKKDFYVKLKSIAVLNDKSIGDMIEILYNHVMGISEIKKPGRIKEEPKPDYSKITPEERKEKLIKYNREKRKQEEQEDSF